MYRGLTQMGPCVQHYDRCGAEEEADVPIPCLVLVKAQPPNEMISSQSSASPRYFLASLRWPWLSPVPLPSLPVHNIVLSPMWKAQLLK